MKGLHAILFCFACVALADGAIASSEYIVKNGDKELLIPVIEECIREVDLEKGCVRVHLMEGLEWS